MIEHSLLLETNLPDDFKVLENKMIYLEKSNLTEEKSQNLRQEETFNASVPCKSFMWFTV